MAVVSPLASANAPPLRHGAPAALAGLLSGLAAPNLSGPRVAPAATLGPPELKAMLGLKADAKQR
jgi:hypothetical protein